MTEIPMPDDFKDPPKGEDDEDEGCCDTCCECWCQIVIAIIALGILIAILTSLF